MRNSTSLRAMLSNNPVEATGPKTGSYTVHLGGISKHFLKRRVSHLSFKTHLFLFFSPQPFHLWLREKRSRPIFCQSRKPEVYFRHSDHCGVESVIDQNTETSSRLATFQSFNTGVLAL